MKKYLEIFSKNKSCTGFTLIELLIAAALTGVVVTGAGFGMVSMLNANKQANSQNKRRIELNRALDFIADEIRQARAINRVSAPVASQPSSTTVEPGTVQPILELELPNIDQPIVYQIAQPKNGSVWLGPRVIYRWGPNLDSDGTYTNSDNSSQWITQPLVDLVEDSKPNPNPVCGTGWTPSPSAPDRHGFYVCVDTNNRIAEVHILGRIITAYATSNNPYEVTTKVFGRPYDIPLGAGGSDLFSVTNGIMSFSKPTNMTFKVIGSSISCGAGAKIPTAATVLLNGSITGTNVDPNKPLELSAATTDHVVIQGTAFAQSCVNKNLTYNSTNTNQVFALRNGDPVPDYTPFNNQTTIKSYLDEYTDPVTKKISIANNEVIYLYELGSTDKTSPAFDAQDLVVLAHAEPK